jgi:hypothetical protein
MFPAGPRIPLQRLLASYLPAWHLRTCSKDSGQDEFRIGLASDLPKWIGCLSFGDSGPDSVIGNIPITDMSGAWIRTSGSC